MTIPRNKWCRMASKKREDFIKKKYEVSFDNICANMTMGKKAFILKRQAHHAMEGKPLSECTKCVGPVFKKPLSQFRDMKKALLEL